MEPLSTNKVEMPSRLKMFREVVMMTLTFAVAMTGAMAGVWWMTRGNNFKPEPKKLSLNPSAILGGKVPVSGKYTLVEFMDYQCPPCRANAPRVDEVVLESKGKLDLMIRHFPLSMHSRAESTASAAEAAREQGKFLLVHHKLMMSEDLSDKAIISIAKETGLDMVAFKRSWTNSAKHAVSEDKKTAIEIGIDSTPSFLLCTPQGEVWKMPSLDHVMKFLAKG